jgi:hypothetical protein
MNRILRGERKMMRKKILTLAIFVGAMLLLTATGVLAASPAVSNSHPVGEEAGSIPTISPTVSITNPVATAIADFFSSVVFTPTYTVTVQSVLDLHSKGMGYGEIARCFFVARFAEVSPDDILAMRQGEGDEKVGWGVIMGQFGFHPGRDANLGAIISGRPLTDTVTLQIERGRPAVPPGWERSDGLGLGRGHGRGHNK